MASIEDLLELVIIISYTNNILDVDCMKKYTRYRQEFEKFADKHDDENFSHFCHTIPASSQLIATNLLIEDLLRDLS